MSASRAEIVRNRIHHDLIPAVPVPFDAAGHMAEKAQEQYARHMANEPIAGVAVWAHTGRGLLLNADQRRQVLYTWRNLLGPGKVIVAGVGASHRDVKDKIKFVDAALSMARDALDGGADAFLV